MNSSISQSFASSATSNPTELDKNLILEAHQKSFEIEILGRREYDIQKDKLLNEQHKNINEEFDRKLNNINMEKKMQRSQAINSKRIKKMNARNDLMKQLIDDAKQLLKEQMQKNIEQYQSLLRQLILQGMVKLLENHIFIKCQYKDIEIIKDLIPDCQKKFKEIFKPIDQDSLARFQAQRQRAETHGQAEITQEFHIPDRHVDVQLVEELSPQEEKSLESGGVILFNGEGTIVVNNTLVQRLILAYQETLPTIREMLFPSLIHTVPVFGYWGFRGAGESIRLALEYSGVKYVDKRYYTREDWFGKDKYALGLEFPNLPYLIDGQNVKMTESVAIQRYVAQKWRPDLLGTTPKERGVIQMLSSQLDALRKELVRTLFDKNNFEEKKILFFNKQGPYLEKLNSFIKQHGKNFLSGDYPRLCDFAMHEVTGMLFLLDPTLKYKYTEFVRVKKNLASCPRIQEYLASQRFGKLHFAPGLAAVEQNAESVYGYWGVRGRGQANRWAIAFTKANVKEVKYQGFDQWRNDKFSIGLEFPNLPYFQDADTGESLTESLAVLKYICFKYNPDLLGKQPGEKGYVEMLLSYLKTLEDNIIGLVWDKAGFEQRRPKQIARWTADLDNLHSTVQRHGQNFLSGANVRACDFLFYEVSQKLLLVVQGFAKKYPLFMAVRRNFEDLAPIKKLMKSQSYVPIVFPPGQTAVNNM